MNPYCFAAPNARRKRSAGARLVGGGECELRFREVANDAGHAAAELGRQAPRLAEVMSSGLRIVRLVEDQRHAEVSMGLTKKNSGARRGFERLLLKRARRDDVVVQQREPSPQVVVVESIHVPGSRQIALERVEELPRQGNVAAIQAPGCAVDDREMLPDVHARLPRHLEPGVHVRDATGAVADKPAEPRVGHLAEGTHDRRCAVATAGGS